MDFLGDDTVVLCPVCCKIRKTGHRTRDAAPNRGDLALALPSADLCHTASIVVAARPRLCVCVCVCVCEEENSECVCVCAGSSRGYWANRAVAEYVIFAMPLRECCASDASHLRKYRGDSGSLCVCVGSMCVHACDMCGCVCERGGCVGHLVFPRGRTAHEVHWI